PDGTLFAGFTDRGWGGQAPGDGLGRIRPTGRAPMEIRDVKIRDDGFEVEFTQRLRDTPTPDKVKLFQYDYDYWWEYGSPARHQANVEVANIAVLPDNRRIWLRAALKPGMCARVRFEGIVSESGEPLLHQEFAYTVNQLPSGPECTELVAKLVPPPPAKERSSEGMLELTWADALDSWKQTGWTAHETDVALDPADKKRVIAQGKREEWENSLVLVNDGAQPSELVSRYEFGDIDVHADFLLPEGGNSGLYLMGRYEVQLLDSTGKTELGYGDCGGIYSGWGEGHVWPGRAPMFNAFRGPGQWHGLTVRFRAPKFDASGKKIANALFERVMIDDVLLQENVEVPEPTRGAMESPKEVASGPLRFQGDHGPVAIKNVWVRRPTNTAPEEKDAHALVANLPQAEGWSMTDGTYTASEGAKPLELLVRDDENGAWENARLSFDARVGRGASSTVYMRDRGTADQGYGLRLDAFSKEKEQAGSLVGLVPIHGQLAPPDLWFHVDFVVREESKGTRVQSFLNGILVAEHLDADRRHPTGRMRVTGPVGGKLELRNLEIVPLPPH
ncbi:MAG TPA: DUF1080 domain-containing protein, partial [Planctomycetota bacterium]|nr:DUF1080 domain-containing protein [Planctomycetota bacterium]